MYVGIEKSTDVTIQYKFDKYVEILFKKRISYLSDI